MTLPRHATVVVIGGGVIGASAAFHLASRGVRDVVVLDRADRPGRGSTGAATGGFRAQFGSAVNIRLSLLAREKLLRFEDDTGADPGYVQAGYLWLASTDVSLAALRDAHRLQQAEGLREAGMVGRDEIARINPSISPDSVLGGAFCPTDGFIRPLSLLEGYRAASERCGARFFWGADVAGIERDASGRARFVATSRGRIEAESVVNAAGAWARGIAAMAGVDLPVEPLRRQVVPTRPTQALPETMPMTIWADDGYHLRMRDGRALLLWPTPGTPGDPYDVSVEPSWVREVEAKTRTRVPALESVPIDDGAAWAGLYEVTPDKHAVLGPAPGCPGLYLANGSSGHGVMHAPALGHLIAEWIVDGGNAALDTSALDPTRFDAGELNEAPGVL